MKFSVIIPVKSLNTYINETVSAIRSQSYGGRGVIITNDYEDNIFEDNRIKLIASGRVAPGIKRDIGAGTQPVIFLFSSTMTPIRRSDILR